MVGIEPTTYGLRNRKRRFGFYPQKRKQSQCYQWFWAFLRLAFAARCNAKKASPVSVIVGKAGNGFLL